MLGSSQGLGRVAGRPCVLGSDLRAPGLRLPLSGSVTPDTRVLSLSQEAIGSVLSRERLSSWGDVAERMHELGRSALPLSLGLLCLTHGQLRSHS